MAIIVAYKLAADPQNATVAADGSVDFSRAKEALSDYDPVAFTAARQLADAEGTEVVGVTVGTAAADGSNAKKGVMARGLDRALVVADDQTRDWTSTKVASALAGLVRRVDGADLLVAGDASVDEGAQLMPALVAAQLGWPCFLEVTSIAKDGAAWVLTQSHDGGSRTVRVEGPVAVAMTSDANEPKTPGMKDILASGKKPTETIAVADLELDEVTMDVTSQRPAAVKERRHEMFEGDDAADQLVAALRAASVL